MADLEKAPISVNERAYKIVEEMISRAEELGVKVTVMPCGALGIDCGIKARGSVEAGLYVTRITLGDLAQVSLKTIDYDCFCLPAVHVSTDHPALATLGVQLGDWEMWIQDTSVIGSGPARALAPNRPLPRAVATKKDAYKKKGYTITTPGDIYRKIGYRDLSNLAVIVLETSVFPPDELFVAIAKQCGVDPKNLYGIIVPTSSIAGSVQIAGRVVEVGIHKVTLLGFDPTKILFGSGYAPIAPVHPDSSQAMGRTNDSIRYGGVAFYIADSDDKTLKGIVREVPSSVSRDYMKSFGEVFRSARHGFYDIDLGIFAPAVITINNFKTGNVFSAGKVNVPALKRALSVHMY